MRTIGDGTALNQQLYDAAGNPIGSIGNALKVYAVNPASGASADPKEPFQLSDRKTVAGVEYYGYIDKDGNWYIASDDGSAIRFVTGTIGDYVAQFAVAETLVYDYFFNVAIGGTTADIAAYQSSDRDTSSDPSYFGFVAASGAWFIKRDDSATGETRYFAGTTGYAAAWVARVSHAYDYFDIIF